ncbi:MAG TPA: TIM-barrel domain-containing protein, partial [Friedmanniella sp.]
PVGDTSGSFLDNGYRIAYDFTAPHEYRVHAEGGTWTEYVFAGPQIPAILEAYTWLTGRMAPPPLWSLGYHQCRWAVYDTAQVEAIALAHRDRGISCDALWLDIEYMDGYRVFTWDRDLFPDPQAMLAGLAEQGFRVVTIIDPGVKHDPGYAVFDSGVEADVLCRTPGGDLYIGQVWPGNTTFPDFSTEAGRRWWGELNAEHVRSGLAGIWNDMNEPATGDIPADRMWFDHGTVPHERFHNQYALLMAMGTTAGLREAMPELRTFVLSRSGFAGIQRYAANWMGDNQARWDHLALSIAMGAGFGLSGQPFVGADVGGFQQNTQPELFVRWMQYGALTPFFRNHTEIGTIDQYAWTFGDTVEDLVRAAISLRYRLLPYLYVAFLAAAADGAPVQRPLVYDHQDDGTVRDVDDQYLLGPDLLVAPVVEAGATARQVYLPEGDWYDWHTDQAFRGRRFVLAPTPMDAIPLYARGGAVVPMWTTAPPSTAGYHPQEIELHLFVPLRDGTYRSALAEDDGLTFALEDGGCVRTTFVVQRRGDQLTVRASVTGDGYAQHARERFVLVLHGAEPAAVLVDGEPVAVVDHRASFPNAGSGFDVDLVLGDLA